MITYLKKSDWGDYWDRCDSCNRELILRGFEVVTALGLQFSEGIADLEQTPFQKLMRSDARRGNNGRCS